MSRANYQNGLKALSISKVAADWHELMIPQRTMRLSMGRVIEQLDPRCS